MATSSADPSWRALVSGDIPNNAANTSGNAATATALASTPSLCSTGNAPTGILANGNATGCASISGGGNVNAGSSLTSNSVILGAGTTNISAGPIGTTNNVLHGITSGPPVFGKVVAADTDTSIAHTGVDVNTSDQVTATHLASALPHTQGGTDNTAATTDGQFLIGSSSDGNWHINTITAGSNVTLTPGHGTLTISATSGASAPAFPINAQTATYTATAADFSNFKAIGVASGTFTLTLVASGSQPAGGQGIWVINYGSGVVTIARNGQNINGATATIPLLTGQGVFIVSDGVNYVAQAFGKFQGPASSVAHDLLCFADSSGAQGEDCGILKTSVPTSVTNDTNVTGSIASNALTLGWTGTLAKGRTLASTVYTDQANTFGAFLNDFSAGTIKQPAASGFAATSASNVGINTATNNQLFWNGANSLINLGITSGAAVNGDCPSLAVSSGKVTITDAGAPCGTVAINSANTYTGGGLQDFSADSIKAPSGPGTAINFYAGADVSVIHRGGGVTTYTASANTDAARGTALLSASAHGTIADGDVIVLHDCGTNYDLGNTSSSHIDLSDGGTLTAHLTSTCAMDAVTVIGRWQTGNGGPMTIQPGMVWSRVSYLTIKTISPGSYGSSYVEPYGLNEATAGHAVQDAVLDHVHIIGQPDGVIFGNLTTTNLHIWDSVIESNWDTYSAGYASGTTSVVDMRNVAFKIVPDPSNGNQGNCVKPVGTTTSTAVINLVNVTCTITGGNGTTVAIGASANEVTVNYYSGWVNITGSYGAENNLSVGTGGTINVANGVGYDASHVAGSLTFFQNFINGGAMPTSAAGLKTTSTGSPAAQTATDQASILVASAVGGTANAITITLVPAITAQTQVGTTIKFTPSANTTATNPTAAVSGLTALTIKKKSGSGLVALVSGDIVNGQMASLELDPTVTYWVLTNPQTSSASGVSSFSGDGVLLSNSGSTGAVTASLASAGGDTLFGRFSGSTGTPSYGSLVNCAVALTYSTTTHTFGCNTSTGGSGNSTYSIASQSLGASSFMPPGGGAAPNATEANVQVKASVASTLSNFHVKLGSTPVSGTLVFTINSCTPSSGACTGVSTGITCSIAAGALECVDDTHTATVAQGDYVSAKITGTFVATTTLTSQLAWGAALPPVTVPNITAANYCPGSGTNTITCSTTNAYTSSGDGDVIELRPANTTTGAVTLNVNSIAAVAVTDTSGGVMSASNTLIAGGNYLCRYTSTGPAWQCASPSNSSIPQIMWNTGAAISAASYFIGQQGNRERARERSR